MASGRLIRIVNWSGILAAAIALVSVGAFGLFKLKDKQQQANATAASLTGGNPHSGKVVIDSLGCASCHTIPGIHRANATVGPPLSGFASRSYIAGFLPNTPDNLTAWLNDPPALHPGTAMPRLGLTESEERNIGAYLYTLK